MTPKSLNRFLQAFLSCLRATATAEFTSSTEIHSLQFLIGDLEVFLSSRVEGAGVSSKVQTETLATNPTASTGFTFDDLLKRAKAITRQFLELHLKCYHQEIDSYELFYHDDILSLRKVSSIMISMQVLLSCSSLFLYCRLLIRTLKQVFKMPF